LLVERRASLQDAIENVGRDFTRGEAGNFRLRGNALVRHAA
jgi:hypothetical protein